MTMTDNKTKIGILLPTRGLLLRGEQPPNMDRIIALASPVSGEPPFIVTERGAVLRVVAVSP